MSADSDPVPGNPEEATVTTRPEQAHPIDQIGPYRVLRKLGEGGMGVVYHARQLEPIRRDVALKLIKQGMDTRQVIARFEGERQALALMDHPNIARVLDAGSTWTGSPYFVMEFVAGIPITRHCGNKRLTLRECIELFIPVCRAIQHAHQKGIIHRDIKPSNVLVAEREGKPVPKVIDFGLSKALSGDLSDASLLTAPGVVMGTFRYMSPEQAELGKPDIDTRSDVYSLGVVLYELITGTTPIEEESVAKSGYVELLQRIREEEPAPPSARARRSGKSAEIAQLRKSDVTRYPGLVHGELDWIVMKALEKDRSRRYETANGLARDLERYLAGEPLEAAPASATYRVGKLVRRHRVWLATAAAFLTLLVAGVIVSSWMAVRATHAEREALRERNAANAVSEFLQNDVLAQASASTQAGPATKPDPDLKVRAALDRAAARIGGKFAGQPLVEASIRHTIASSYQDLGLYAAAQPQAERALELRRKELGEQHADTARSLAQIGRLKWLQGKYAESETYFARALEIDRRVLGEEHPNTLTGMDNLASAVAYQGKWPEAEQLFRKAMSLQTRVLGAENSRTLATMNNLAATCFREGKYEEAGELHRKALEIRQRVLGEEHPSTLVTLNNIGEVYLAQGRYDEAEPVFTKTLQIRRRVLGEEHPNTLTTVRDLGVLHQAKGEYAAAEPLLKQAWEGRKRVLGEEHPETLTSARDLAKLYQAGGRTAQAASILAKTVEARRRTQGESHPETASALASLGEVRLQEKKFAEAEVDLREALRTYEKIAPETWPCFRTQFELGAALASQNKYAEAEPLLLSGYDRLSRLDSTTPAVERLRTGEMEAVIAAMYQNWGKPDKLAEWKAKAAR